MNPETLIIKIFYMSKYKTALGLSAHEICNIKKKEIGVQLQISRNYS